MDEEMRDCEGIAVPMTSATSFWDRVGDDIA